MGEFEKRIKECEGYDNGVWYVDPDSMRDVVAEFKKEFKELWDSQLVDTKWHEELVKLMIRWIGEWRDKE